MNLTKIREKKWNYSALAFAFPFLGMVIIMMVSQYTPFGKYSMLYSDMYHQYYPFFVSFRNALRSGDSLLYIWNMGLGMDHLGLISYYVASPLNLLSVLIPESWLLSYFSFLMPIKLGLASLFFSIFLKKTFHKNDLSVTLFSCFYGLSAWALGYQWNVMWLDTFALLPLVVTGMISLLKERKVFLYTFTLFLSIATNYYIGLFTCIFVFLLFFCYEICRWESFSCFFRDLTRIAIFSALAIGMTAFLELPTLAALQCTQSSVNRFPKGFKLNIADENTWLGLLDAMRQVAGNQNGGLEPTFKEGLPNLYCGVITNLFAFLYFMTRKVKVRDKICAGSLLIFFNLSFVIRQLDYIWHGFHFTNMIPYRFSFLYSFVLLYMAYKAYTCRKSYTTGQLISAGMLSVALILCNADIGNGILWAYNGVFLLLYFGAIGFARYRKNLPEQSDPAAYLKAQIQRRRVGSSILAGFMTLELVLNLVSFAIWFPGTNVSNYPMGKKDAAAAITYMKQREQDNPFYRAEATHTQTLNDGAINNYYGITTFTSSANVKVTEFMKALGYGAKNTYNRYSFEESSPVANLFLGLKYMLDRDGECMENPYFTDVQSFGKVHLLENNAYLPLGFLANTQLLNTQFDNNGNPFEFQNRLFREATGLPDNVWNLLWGNSLTVSGSDLELSSAPQSSSCSYTADDMAGTVQYVYAPDREGFMCIYIDQSKRNGFTVSKNGTEIYNESYSLPQTLAVSQVRPGDVIDITFKCKKGESGSINVQAAVMDDNVFRRGYEVLSQSVLELSSMKNTRLEGTINCSRDGVLYTSIPQNGNWHTVVDGEEVQPVLIGDAMVGLLLSEGHHEITFFYKNREFEIGWKVSLLCLCLFVILYIILYREKNYSGKHLRKRNR